MKQKLGELGVEGTLKQQKNQKKVLGVLKDGWEERDFNNCVD